MKRILLLFCMMFCFQQRHSAQIITSQKGLTTIVFNTTHAVITVYLPDDLQDGDKISGTFSIYNEGLTDEQMEKSLAEVRKYKFNFSNPETQTSVLQRFINLPTNQLINLLPLKITSSLILLLTESSGKVHKAVIKPNGAPSVTVDDCLTPEHILAGYPLRITGTFDGIGTNTRVNIKQTAFPILAESPRQCIAEVPEYLTLADTLRLSVVEDFKPKCSQVIVPVKLSVLTPKNSLKKGENTTVYITIKGLQDMEIPSHLLIENKTPLIASIKDGNKQDIEITSAMFSGNEYKLNLTVQGITAGEFEIEVKLDMPEDFPDTIER